MNVALIGASGIAGSRILIELVNRGHTVTAIARSPTRIAAGEGVCRLAVDLHDQSALTDALRGHDAVISSVHFTASDADKLIGAAKASSVRRYLVVGGAGSLEVAPGKRVIDTPDFPAAYRNEAQGGINFLDKLRAEKNLDWTFLSPSAVFTAGERTGTFVLVRTNF